MKFLEKLANYILSEKSDNLENLCVVLPNVRAKLFLSRFLSKHSIDSMWMPKILSSKELFESISELKTTDDINLLGIMHEALPQHLVDNNNAAQFLNWAQSILQDFKEVDQQLVDADKMFQDLYSIKELEAWSPNEAEENLPREKYLSFCKELPGIYSRFNEGMKKHGLGHGGRIERLASENLETFHIEAETEYIVAGFNAFTKAEKKIFNYLKEQAGAELIFDYDRFYTDDEIHEAGFFARENSLFIKQNPLNWTENNFTDIVKDIKVYKCAHSIEQTYVLRQILEARRGKLTEGNTAIVLTDESLLIPVLKQLPDYIKNINVTMGYSLKYSPFYGFFDGIFRMYVNLELRKKKAFYHHDLRRLLRNSVFQELLSQKAKVRSHDLLERIDRNNLVYISIDEVNAMIDEEDWVKGAFFPKTASIANQLGIIDNLIKVLDLHYIKDERLHSKIQREFIFHHHGVNEQLRSVSDVLGEEVDLATIHKIWRQYTQVSKVQFTGEPLLGLQIMGLLETRNLDFEEVFILNMNEGNLPSSRTYNSIIPYDLKKQNDLLVHREREAVFAYHFYRLLQRTSSVHLMYQLQGSDLSNGEMSRFVLQLIKELPELIPEHSIEEIEVESLAKDELDTDMSIERSDYVKTKILEKFEKGISPTALSTYLNCPLDFYYKYIVGLRESEQLSESVEASTFGQILHDTLEYLYQDKVGKVLTEVDILEMSNAASKVLRKNFERHFDPKFLESGKNILALNIADKYLQQFFRKEKSRLNKGNITVIGLEKELSAELKTNFGKVTIRGKLDRLDQNSGIVSIIDYKTGLTELSELRVKDMEDIAGGKKNKALQLMIYTLLVSKQENEFNSEVYSSSIYSMRAFKKGYIPLVFGDQERIDLDILKEFETELIGLLEDIYSDESPFEHTASSLYCEFCE